MYIHRSAVPYRRLLRRMIEGPGTPKTIAFKEEVLCPPGRTKTRAPIFLPGQLERITGSTRHLTLRGELESMLAGEYAHEPTIAYHIRNATLYNGSIYAGSMKYFIADDRMFNNKSDPEHFREAGLASTAVGYRYFGHWLRDDCIQYLLAAECGKPLAVQSPLSNHMREYAGLFCQDWTGCSHAIIDHLVIFQDFAQNSSKRARYLQLSERIAKEFPSSGDRSKLVYIRRGASGAPRLIENEETLINVLQQSGFEILEVTSSLTSILQTLRRAKMVVSIEGSNINHFNFCAASDCGLIVLQPADRFTAFHRHWAECMDVRFGFVVGEKHGERYAFSSSEVLRTVDVMLRELH